MISTQIDTQGVAVLSWSNPLATGSTADFFRTLEESLNTLYQDEGVKGIVLTHSGKTFLNGPSADELYSLDNPQKALSWYTEIRRVLRKMETSTKPLVAAIAGEALGLGFELSLACHHLAAADHSSVRFGFYDKPWLPVCFAGGTQRLPRRIGLRSALSYLLERKKAAAPIAVKEGLIDAVVSPTQLIDSAKSWILKVGEGQQPWDKKGFKMPGGEIQTPHNLQLFSGIDAMVHQKTAGHYRIEANTLSTLYEGLQVDFETALNLEGQYFAKTICSKEVRNATRTLSILRATARQLNTKPAVSSAAPFKHVGIVGGGMMGSGIALAAAASHIQVTLLDQTKVLADKGKGYAARYFEKAVQKGKMSEEDAKACLERIATSENFSDFKSCDIVVEAVTESRAIKETIFKGLQQTVGEDVLIASNTSTLPISSLAQYLSSPARFIGLHFFSPVEKMELLEIIRGEKTSESSVAQAFIFAKQLGKTPILVNDGRGFYTSRVFQTYLLEGFRMLAEGIVPALIENSGRLAGMPVGPLALADEVGIDLIAHILKQTREDLGSAYQPTQADSVVDKMCMELHRHGRKAGAGFYEYPKEAPKQLWQALAKHYPMAAHQPNTAEVQNRLLVVQTLEAARCQEEGIVLSSGDADLGSILGWGFPAFTGGVISYIDYLGLPRFIEITKQLQKQYGGRFLMPHSLQGR